MSDNSNLHIAKKAKNDEFYTQLSDIEAELQHYTDHFKNKTIYCNCDDPTWSNFWRYFHENFSALELKKLISTHYEPSGIPSYVMTYEGGDDSNVQTGVKTPLKGNGDFRSEECIKLLNEADIVVTNPAFSLFREYTALLIEHEKKFIIIGNMNAIANKKFFPFVQAGKVHLGYGGNISMTFRMPDDYELRGSSWVGTDGRKYAKVSACAWYTNLDIAKQHEKLVLQKHYTPEEYPAYVNCDAVNVNKTADIPCDYDGVMGVPLSFMNKYCPEQFEIVGFDQTSRKPIQDCGLPKGTYTPGGSRLYIKETDDWYRMCYARILIRRRR